MEQRHIRSSKNKVRTPEIECMETCPMTGEISTLKQAYADLKPHITELMNANMTAVRGVMQANHDAVMEQFKAVTYRQDIANGRTKKLEERMEKVEETQGVIKSDLDGVVRNQKVVRWIQEHPLKAVAVGLITGFIFAEAASVLSFEQILQWVK